jgi:hypothetical protein
MVAGAPGSAAKSGLVGPKPFVLQQQGAVGTLSLGCLLTQEGKATVAGQGVPDMAFEAMKLALQDIVPQIKPPMNATLTCFNAKVKASYAYNVAGVPLCREGVPGSKASTKGGNMQPSFLTTLNNTTMDATWVG